MQFRKHYGYDVQKASDEVAITIEGESMTIQSQRDDADLNVLMERYGITGKMPEDLHVPVYGDFTDVNDFQSAMNAVADAQFEFMKLPARIRARFENDPQQLLEFVSDDKNIEEARYLGLLKEKADGPKAAGSSEGGDVKASGGKPGASKSGDEGAPQGGAKSAQDGK